MMVDPGENKSQRILVDTDGDGNFLGTDDISSPWLTSSCSLDEGGNKTDPDCAVTFSLEMGPSNGLLPGMVQFQIQHMNGTQSAGNITFSAFFSEDNHVVAPESPESTGEMDTLHQRLAGPDCPLYFSRHEGMNSRPMPVPGGL